LSTGEVTKPGSTTGGLSILFAEDNAVNRLVGSRMLGDMGHTVELASNGAEAVRMAEAGRYDLIMMDIEMPVMDGLEATRQIRRAQPTNGAHLPIIAMSAYASNVNRDRCIEAGMDSYLGKPFTPDKIREMLTAYSSASQPPRPAQPVVSAPIEPRAQLASAVSFDIEVGLQALGGSLEFLREAVEVFVTEDYPRHMGDLREGLRAQDAKKIKAAAHGLKGGLGSFGALAARETADQIEQIASRGELANVTGVIPTLERQVTQFAEDCARATKTDTN
jgi:CheY-like chemotaxis protein